MIINKEVFIKLKTMIFLVSFISKVTPLSFVNLDDDDEDDLNNNNGNNSSKKKIV